MSNYERALVAVRVINNILPIENADAIEIAAVDGWNVVIEKNSFKIGDKGVYFEIDYFLPIEERYEFLRKRSLSKMGDQEGFRLTTIRLRGKISQGLLLPLSSFPELKNQDIKIGVDLTKTLKVQLYEPPIPDELAGMVKG